MCGAAHKNRIRKETEFETVGLTSLLLGGTCASRSRSRAFGPRSRPCARRARSYGAARSSARRCRRTATRRSCSRRGARRSTRRARSPRSTRTRRRRARGGARSTAGGSSTASRATSTRRPRRRRARRARCPRPHVPFAIESALSGVRKLTAASYAWYRRNFTLPNALRPAGDGGRLLLHFEAVDWEAHVYVDGVLAGAHAGGYDPFELTSERTEDTPRSAQMNRPPVSGGGGQTRGAGTRGLHKFTKHTGLSGAYEGDPCDAPATRCSVASKSPPRERRRVPLRARREPRRPRGARPCGRRERKRPRRRCRPVPRRTIAPRHVWRIGASH